MEHVTQTQATTRDLVFIGRTDAATGSPDLGDATGLLARLVQTHMVGQDQRAGRRQTQAITHRHVVGFKLTDFLDQRFRRQHDTVADDAGLAWVEDAGRDQVEDGLLAVQHQGMTCVVATLETHDGAGGFGQQVDDLALAFITPLGAEHDYILAHGSYLFR